MSDFNRYAAPLALLLLVCAAGCENVKFKHQADNSPPPQAPKIIIVQEEPAEKNGSSAEAEPAEEDLGPLEDSSGFDFSFSGSGGSAVRTVQHKHPGLEKNAAAEMVLNLIKESAEYGPTLVVWLIDRSQSAQNMSRDLGQLIAAPYGSFAALSSTDDPDGARLLTAVCAFGQQVEFPLDPPNPDPKQLAAALQAVALDESGKEMTFTAVKTCLEKYLSYRTERRREVILVLVTDEAGDDAQLVEQVAQTPRRYSIPIYVLGVPAPFGRDAAMDQSVEAPFDYQGVGTWRPIRQGPESLQAERLQLGFSGDALDLELIDSGFGPFGLEYLCRKSGGRFLALRPRVDSFSFSSSGEWPAFAVYSFNPEVMRRYVPDYISQEEYQALLAENGARRALCDAARLSGLRLGDLKRDFEKRSEAELTRDLSLAQQAAAGIEPAVNRLFETLEKGEADRDRLQGARWQAAYDLAMGRATAVKARIEGYNAMLAALKRGRNFEDPSSTTWVLQEADTIEASSALRRLVEKASTYLQRVVDEHPETPWAAIAEWELETPAGWEWTEK